MSTEVPSTFVPLARILPSHDNPRKAKAKKEA